MTSGLARAQEITDPRMIRSVEKFILAALLVDAANWPLPSRDGGGRSGKPGSRAPGREQCAWAVRRLGEIADDAVDKMRRLAQDAENAWANTRLEHDAEPVTQVGGVDITIPATTGPSVGRRKDGTMDGTPRGPRLPGLCQGP